MNNFVLEVLTCKPARWCSTTNLNISTNSFHDFPNNKRSSTERIFVSQLEAPACKPRDFKVCFQFRMACSNPEESQVYSPAQVTKINSLHYKALRQILQVKNSFYHRVLSPSEAPCSNEHLIALAYAIHPSLFPPSLRISNTRLKYLGHILRHPRSFEHQICLHSSYSLRTISSPLRKGTPRAHWPEKALAEASNKVQMITRKQMPAPGKFLHEYYQLFTIHELKNFVSSHMPRWYNTTPHIRRILPVAQDRELWKELCTK